MNASKTNFGTHETLPIIMQHTRRVRDKAKDYGKIFEQSYPSINAFSTISNGLVLTFELLYHYHDAWWNKERKLYLTSHHVERVTTICKWAFIHSFSIIEYISKELLKRKTFRQFEQLRYRLLNGERVYFSTIMQQSKNIGLLSDEEKKAWDSLREIRNALVHNNAYADKDGVLEHTIENTPFRFVYERDKPLTHNMQLGIILVEIMIERYHQWVQKMLNL